MIKFCLYILYFFLFVSTNIEAKVKIYHKNGESDSIDFAMRYYENDEVIRYITVENNTEDTLYMGIEAPSFATVNNVDFDETHYAFIKRNETSTRVFPPNSKGDVALKYYDDTGMPVDKLIGKHAANLFIGLMKDLEDINSIVHLDTFFLFGYATDLYFDIYKDTLSFDSVFVDSETPISKEIILRNNSPHPFIDVTEANINVKTSITNGQEFFISEFDLPLKLASRTDPGQEPELAKVSYKPKDRGIDSAEYYFKGELNGTVEDTVIERTCYITGYGVDFDYAISQVSQTEYTFKNDTVTIDLGNVKTNELKSLNAIIKNLSNIDIEIKSATFSDSYISGTFNNLSDTFVKDGEFNLNCEFILSQKGLFNTSILIETDLQNRKINGFQENKHKFVKINLTGRGIEPRLNLQSDTLDLGTISTYGPCDNTRETIIKLRNSGNFDLEIIDYFYDNQENFNVSIDEFLIAENEETDLKLSFLQDDEDDFGIYIVNITFITNQSKPRDTVRFTAKINVIQAIQVDLNIPNIRFKPGSRIKVPILINQSNINISDRFSATMSYDNTLLNYNSFSTLNTSSVNADNQINISGEEGKKIISILKPQSTFFTNEDTLINLYFDTFIGYESETSIVLELPKFADADCEDLLPVSFNSGRIIADSIPNIDLIYYNFSSKITSSVYPNPISNKFELKIKKNVEDNLKIKIEFLNSFSNLIEVREISLYKDENKIEFITKDLPSGVYFIRTILNNETQTIPLIISK